MFGSSFLLFVLPWQTAKRQNEPINTNERTLAKALPIQEGQETDDEWYGSRTFWCGLDMKDRRRQGGRA